MAGDSGQTKSSKSIGLRIAKLCEQNFKNKAECARGLGILPQSLSEIEKGRVKFDSEKIYKYADFFEVDAGWLLTGDDDRRECNPSRGKRIEQFLMQRYGNRKICDISADIGVSYVRISDWMSGGVIQQRELLTLADLGCDLHWLFTGRKTKLGMVDRYSARNFASGDLFVETREQTYGVTDHDTTEILAQQTPPPEADEDDGNEQGITETAMEAIEDEAFQDAMRCFYASEILMRVGRLFLGDKSVDVRVKDLGRWTEPLQELAKQAEASGSRRTRRRQDA